MYNKGIPGQELGTFGNQKNKVDWIDLRKISTYTVALRMDTHFKSLSSLL